MLSTERIFDSKQTQRAFLTEILVDAPAEARAIVTFGDSITDGDGSTIDGNDRWPDRLAERFAAAGGAPVAILNEGISGAKVLADRMGVNALARFDRDVLSQPKADTVVLMMGINDVDWPGCGLAPRDPEPSADDIIAGYKQLIARAHAHGMKIIAATLTPFAGAFDGTPFQGYYTPEKEKIRLALNDFLRSGAFDGVIDFDKVIVDPQKPGTAQAKFDKGDHLHPNAAGYEAMGAAIDLKTSRPNSRSIGRSRSGRPIPVESPLAHVGIRVCPPAPPSSLLISAATRLCPKRAPRRTWSICSTASTTSAPMRSGKETAW